MAHLGTDMRKLMELTEGLIVIAFAEQPESVECQTCAGVGEIPDPNIWYGDDPHAASMITCPECNGYGRVGADHEYAHKEEFEPSERDHDYYLARYEEDVLSDDFDV